MILGILSGMVVDGTERVRPKNRLVTALLVAAAVPLGSVAALRLVGFDGDWYTLIALSLTPYVACWGLVLGGLALVLRRWWTGAIALLLAVVLGVLVAPRAFASSVREMPGKTVRVMASNLYFGRADPRAVVDLVRSQRIDVLNLVELTPDAVAGLDQAGLGTLLPYRVLHAAGGASGSGILSRFPLKEVDLTGDSAAKQPGAQVDLGAGVVLEVVAVKQESMTSGPSPIASKICAPV